MRLDRRIRKSLAGLTAGMALILFCILAISDSSTAQTPTVKPPVQNPEPKKDESAVVRELFGLSPSNSTDGTSKPYQIRHGDELAIQVLGEDKLSRPYIVGPDGRISLDFIGSVLAAGQTREQLAERITRKLAEIYYTPIVSVAVSKYTPLTAYVLGQVMSPGKIQFNNDTSLLRALTLAGGVARENAPGQGFGNYAFSPPETVYVIRNPDTIINVNLKDLMASGNRALDVPVYDDDLVFVPIGKHRQVFVMGEVLHPTVVDLKIDDMDVLGAIGQAGGFTPDASQSQVKVIRRKSLADQHPDVFNVDFKELKKTGNLAQDIKLQDQDIVVVPRSKASYLKYFTQNGPLGFVSLYLSLTKP